jgi:hypothetical protein
MSSSPVVANTVAAAGASGVNSPITARPVATTPPIVAVISAAYEDYKIKINKKNKKITLANSRDVLYSADLSKHNSQSPSSSNLYHPSKDLLIQYQRWISFFLSHFPDSKSHTPVIYLHR